MKLQLTNSNSMLSLLFIAKVACCKSAVIGRLVNLKMSGLVFAFTSQVTNPNLFLLPLVKKVIKEIIGFEVDPELLIILFTGYSLRAMQMFAPAAVVKKIKYQDTIHYRTPEEDLKLAS
jgi:hypothetical protein